MKVASSSLQWQAQHSSARAQTRSTKLEAWVGERSPAASVTVSASTRRPPTPTDTGGDIATQAGGRTAEREGDEYLTPMLRIARDLIERMTGVRASVSSLSEQDLSSSAGAGVTVSISSNARAQSANQGVGWGVRYEEHNVVQEAESTQWAAQGVVRTADGKEIKFSVQLDMQRSYRQESSSQVQLGDAKKVDPLVINFDGTAAQLQDSRFSFDLNADGQNENIPLLAGNRGFLALDRNANGKIDDGRELFGPTSGNGYADLAQYDEDRNGWIDEGDSAYKALRVWTPTADGSGSLRSLQEVGVGALSLAAGATPFEVRTADNRSLGTVRATSAYLREDGSAGTMQQVDLTA